MVPYVIGWGKERLTAKSLDFFSQPLGYVVFISNSRFNSFLSISK